MKAIKSQIDQHGKLLIPSPIRKKLNFNVGDEVFIKYSSDNIDNAEIVISTFHNNITNARSILNKYDNLNLNKTLTQIRKEDNDADS